MVRYRTVAEVEADLLALRASAERAGVALACIFSSSAEYEADLIRARRAAGAFSAPRQERYVLRPIGLAFLFAAIFLML